MGEVLLSPPQHHVYHPDNRYNRKSGTVIKRIAPDLKGVERATKDLQNWNTPGYDSLPAESFNIDDDEPIILERLGAILIRVWNEEYIPQ